MKRRVTIIVLTALTGLALVLFVVLGVFWYIRRNTGRRLLWRAETALRAQDFDKASGLASRYVADYPQDNAGRRVMARAYMGLGRYKEAKAEMQTALEQDPEDVSCASLMAGIYLSDAGSRLENTTEITYIEATEALLDLLGPKAELGRLLAAVELGVADTVLNDEQTKRLKERLVAWESEQTDADAALPQPEKTEDEDAESKDAAGPGDAEKCALFYLEVAMANVDEQESTDQTHDVRERVGRVWNLAAQVYAALSSYAGEQAKVAEAADRSTSAISLKGLAQSASRAARESYGRVVDALLPVVAEAPETPGVGPILIRAAQASGGERYEHVLTRLETAFKEARAEDAIPDAEAAELLSRALVQRDVLRSSPSKARSRYEQAVREQDEILKNAPDNLAARRSRARYLWRMGGEENLREAEAEARRVLDMSPGDEGALEILASLMMADGRPEEAYDLLDTYVDASTRSLRLLTLFGRAAARAGDRQGAKSTLRGVMRRLPQLSPEARQAYAPIYRQTAMLLADLLRKEGRYAEALTDISTVYREQPHDPSVLAMYVTAAVQASRQQRSAALHERALAAADRALQAQRDLANPSPQDRQDGDEEDADGAGPRLRMLEVLMRAYDQLGATTKDATVRAQCERKAREAAEMIVAKEAETHDELLIYARSLNVLGRQTEAERIALELIEENPDWAPYRVLAADIYRRTSRPLKALRSLRDAVRIDPKNTQFLNDLSELLLQLGMIEEAEDVCRRTLEYDRNNHRAKVRLTGILLRRGEDLSEVIDEQAGGTEEQYLRAAQLYRVGKYESLAKAAEIYDEIHQRSGGDASALRLKAQVHVRQAAVTRDPDLRKEALDDAFDAFRRVISLQPDSLSSYVRAAKVAASVLTPDQIEQRLRGMPEANHYLVELALGRLYGEIRNPDRAIEVYQALYRRGDAPAWIRAAAYVASGQQLLRAGREEEGLKVLQHLARARLDGERQAAGSSVDPDPSDDWMEEYGDEALMAMAVHHLSRGRTQQAIQALSDLQDVCMIDVHSNVSTLRRTARLLVRIGQLPEALEIAAALERTFPAEVGPARFRAELLQTAGRHEQAVEVLRKAIAINPTDLHSRRRLIRSLDRLNRVELALEEADAMAEIGEQARAEAAEEKIRLFAGRGLAPRAISAVAALEAAIPAKKPRVLLDLARSYILLDRREDARRVLPKVPSYSGRYHLHAQMMLAGLPEDEDERIREAKALWQEDPGNPQLSAWLMGLLRAHDRPDEAVEVYRTYAAHPDADPDIPQVPATALLAMVEAGDRQAAVELCSALAERSNPRAWNLRRAVLLPLSDPTLLSDDLTARVLPRPEESARLEALLGLAAAAAQGKETGPWFQRWRKFRDAEAEAFRQRGRRLPPLSFSHVLAMRMAGELGTSPKAVPGYDRAGPVGQGLVDEFVRHAASAAGDTSEASQLARAVVAAELGLQTLSRELAVERLRKRPQSQIAARIAASAGDIEQVKEVARILKPEDSLTSLLLRGQLLLHEGKAEEAADVIAEAVALDETNTDLVFLQASAFESAGKLAEALDLYRRGYEETGDPNAANNFAYVTTLLHPDDPVKLRKAEDILRGAMGTRQSPPHVLDTLAQLDMLQGQKEEAVEQIRTAVRGLPGSIEVQAHAALIEKQAGNYDWAWWHMEAANALAVKKDNKLTPAEKTALREAREALKTVPKPKTS